MSEVPLRGEPSALDIRGKLTPLSRTGVGGWGGVGLGGLGVEGWG